MTRPWLLVAAATALLAAAAATTPLPFGLVERPGIPVMFESGPASLDGVNFLFEQLNDGRVKGQIAGADASYDPKRLPATFKVTFPNGGVCTATLVGPRVVLTAAHCLDKRVKNWNGVWSPMPGGIRLAGASDPYPFKTCELAPAYVQVDIPPTRTPRNASDWALCELHDTVDKVRYETISLNPADVAGGTPVMLAGFGCTQFVVVRRAVDSGGPVSATVLAGLNILEQGAVSGWITARGRVGSTQAIICPGDSGGAAYAYATTKPGNDVGRRVTSINSGVGPSDEQKKVWRTEPPSAGAVEAAKNTELLSYLAPLADPTFRAFVDRFQKASPATRRICGIDLPAAGSCRS